MAAIDRAIEYRGEDLIGAIDNAISELRTIRGQVEEGSIQESPRFDTSNVQRLFWEWRTLKEHKNYGCG